MDSSVQHLFNNARDVQGHPLPHLQRQPPRRSSCCRPTFGCFLSALPFLYIRALMPFRQSGASGSLAWTYRLSAGACCGDVAFLRRLYRVEFAALRFIQRLVTATLWLTAQQKDYGRRKLKRRRRRSGRREEEEEEEHGIGVGFC